MKDITNAFGSLYRPQKAFLIYERSDHNKTYVESYDIGADGNPINAHPLSVSEGKALAKALLVSNETKGHFLKSSGLLPANLLYLSNDTKAFAVWHTPKQSVQLLFKQNLGIRSGIAQIPPMVWKAGRNGLAIYAIAEKGTICLANLGRQLFAESELGLFKSVALINRINRFFGTNWKAVNHKFGGQGTGRPNANLYITCVDTVSSRIEVARILRKHESISPYERNKPLYWMDMGNSRDTGQVLLSTVEPIEQPASEKYTTVGELPKVSDEFGDLLAQSENNDNTPSCSLAEALDKQDLFINSTLANLGASLLWSVFREGVLFNRGFFLNLREFRTQPIKVA
jgi:PRTRC genetic system ThiF family protein